MGSSDDRLDVPTHQRMLSLATAQASARDLQARGATASELGADRHDVSLDEAQRILDAWPAAPRKVAEKLLDHYGPPNEATSTKMFWYRVGPWARMELTADEVLHHFPTPHTDFLTQYVDYPVPAEKASALAEFDGSVIVDRTAGQIGARCDHESYNTLTLNLAVDIIEGRRTVDDAREFYAETAAAFVLGRDAPYAERLQFTAPSGQTGDTDESVITGPMAGQIEEKLKDLVGTGEPPR
jgi:hypothetical protein